VTQRYFVVDEAFNVLQGEYDEVVAFVQSTKADIVEV
jgi:hypothetical protein